MLLETIPIRNTMICSGYSESEVPESVLKTVRGKGIFADWSRAALTGSSTYCINWCEWSKAAQWDANKEGSVRARHLRLLSFVVLFYFLFQQLQLLHIKICFSPNDVLCSVVFRWVITPNKVCSDLALI